MDENASRENNSFAAVREATLSEANLKDEQEECPPLEINTAKQKAFFGFLYLFLGFSMLLYWNCLISILYDLRANIYTDYPSMTDTLNAANNICGILAVIYGVKTGAMNQHVIRAAGVTQGVCCVLIAITAQVSSGITGVVLLHVWSAIAGLCSGCYQGGGMALASVMPVPMVSYLSAGQGICGVLSFLLWMLVSHVGLSTRQALWILMSIAAAIMFAAAYVQYYICHIPYCRVRIKQVQKSLREEVNNPNAPTYRFLFKELWRTTVTIYLVMMSTLLVFPNLVLEFQDASFTNYVMGSFQFGDCIGRGGATFVAATVLGVTSGLYWTVGRSVVCVILAVLCWRIPSNAFFGSRSFHMVLIAFLAASEGHMITCVFINFPKLVKQEDWRSRASAMTLLALLIGIASGLWLSRLLIGVVPKVEEA